MLDPYSLFSIALAFLVAAISPGPATISTATVAMHHGRRASLIYGIGLAFGLAFWGLIAASGIGVMLQSSIYVLSLLKTVGAVYLFWLAILSARSAWHPSRKERIVSVRKNWFFQGLLLNLSNPKAVLAWMASLSVGLGSNDNVYSIVAATSICIGIGFLVYAFYSLLFSVRGVMDAYERCRRWIDGTVAGLFALFGVGLIRSSFAK